MATLTAQTSPTADDLSFDASLRPGQRVLASARYRFGLLAEERYSAEVEVVRVRKWVVDVRYVTTGGVGLSSHQAGMVVGWPRPLDRFGANPYWLAGTRLSPLP